MKIVLLFLLLTGCASLGIAPAGNFEQKLAYAYATNTAIREASTSSLNAGTISSKDMETIIPLNNQTRQVLDAAKAAMSVGDIKTAEAKLLLATNILTQLQSYLRNKGVKASLERRTVWASMPLSHYY